MKTFAFIIIWINVAIFSNVARHSIETGHAGAFPKGFAMPSRAHGVAPLTPPCPNSSSAALID
jgi:hypothetical protein